MLGFEVGSKTTIYTMQTICESFTHVNLANDSDKNTNFTKTHHPSKCSTCEFYLRVANVEIRAFFS